MSNNAFHIAYQRKTDALDKLDQQAPMVHDRESLKSGLLRLLQPGESIPAALRRLGGGRPGELLHHWL